MAARQKGEKKAAILSALAQMLENNPGGKITNEALAAGIGVSEDGRCVYTCEGNSGNRLKIGKRDKSTIQHYIDVFNDGQGLGFPRKDFNVKNLKGSRTR